MLELTFRATPLRSRSQGYACRGKAELDLTSYGLHGDELSVLRHVVQTNQTRDSLQMGAGEAMYALDDLVHRIEQLVTPQSSQPAETSSPETNPLSALLSLLKSLVHWAFSQSVGQASVAEVDLRPDVRLEVIARGVGMSLSGFSHYFRRATGRTVSEVVNEVRIGHARRMLIETDQTVSEVAYACGFGSLSNFNRRFQDITGLSPTQYRSRYQTL